MRLRVNQRRGGVLRTSASTTLRLGRSAEESQGFKLGSGDPTVQDYRGASGNVAMVELGTRLAIERARTVTLCAGINRHEAEDERALRERNSDPLGPALCTGHREVHSEA